MKGESQLTSGDVAYFRQMMTWRVISAAATVRLQRHRAELESATDPRKMAELQGRIQEARDIFGMVETLEKRLKQKELAAEKDKVVQSEA